MHGIHTLKLKTRPSILHHPGELLLGTSHQSILHTFDCEEYQSLRPGKRNIAHMILGLLEADLDSHATSLMLYPAQCRVA